jgi:hypothetical protein
MNENILFFLSTIYALKLVVSDPFVCYGVSKRIRKKILDHIAIY